MTMQAINSQRHELFLRLYAEHEPALRGFVRSLVPTREDSRDVMQEIAVILWRKFGEIMDSNDFRPWAFGVARYEALAWRRDKARDRLVFSEESIALLADQASTMVKQLDVQREALEECLEKLPAEHRKLVNEAYLNGARIDRLAELQGRTAMTLYKTLHRIRLALVECTRNVLLREAAS